MSLLYGRYFTGKTIIAKPFDSEFSNGEKHEILTWRKTLISQVKSYIDNNVYPAKVNVIDSTKEVIDQLEISKYDYYRALSISKDKDLELRLKTNFCFVNSYFDIDLKAWQANMDIQLVFNEYKTVTYRCHHFSKTKDRCSQAMKQATTEAFENNMHCHDIMETFAKAHLSNQECFFFVFFFLYIIESVLYRMQCTIFCQNRG